MLELRFCQFSFRIYDLQGLALWIHVGFLVLYGDIDVEKKFCFVLSRMVSGMSDEIVPSGSEDCSWFRSCRLLRIHQARTSMHLSSTSRTFWPRLHHISSIPCTIPTVRALTSSVDIRLVSGRVFRPQCLMACGSTSRIMMHPPSSWSLWREIRGTNVLHYIRIQHPHSQLSEVDYLAIP